MIGEDRDSGLERIPVGRIRVPSPRLRRDPSPEEIDRLEGSIRKHGLLHPIVVRPAGREYEVICGARRLAACRALGMKDIPALVRRVDDRQAFVIALAENVHREPIGDDERGGILKRLIELFPGRPEDELVSWLGQAVDSGTSLPAVIDKLERAETPRAEPVPDPAVVVIPSEGTTSDLSLSVGRTRYGVLARVRRLLRRFKASGELDPKLLERLVDELFRMQERLPAVVFLNLRYTEEPRFYLPRHCLNVAKLAMHLARALGWEREEVRMLAIAALLHDVGMMRVEGDIFLQRARLDEESWKEVQRHPVEGSLLLTKETVLRDVVRAVALEHHERCDGKGYPAGKVKDEIHIYARLINVVDTYEAMVSPRTYRLPMLPYEAMKAVLNAGAAWALDWDLARAFMESMSMYPIGSYVRLTTGELAQVVRATPASPERPVIRIEADAEGRVFQDLREVDLAQLKNSPTLEAVPAPV